MSGRRWLLVTGVKKPSSPGRVFAVTHLVSALLVLLGAACVDLSRPAGIEPIGVIDGGGNPSDGGGPDREPSPDEGNLGGSGGADAADFDGEPAAGGMGGGGGAGGAAGAGVPDAMPDVPVVAPVDTGVDVDNGPAKLAIGAACQQASQCTSNFCTDGVCCNTDCLGACRSCAIGGSPGTCRPAAAGTDPRNSCNEETANSCGQTGVCDANQACARYPATTICSPPACSSTGQFTFSRCNGAGTCTAAALVSCQPYACTTTGSCRTSCTSKADCASPADCFGNTCGGIVGTYFAGLELMGRSVTRVDQQIDFDWGVGVPMATFPNDGFSVRWNGQLTPRFNETTTFYVRSDDGVRLWVDGTLIINDWTEHSTYETSGSIALRGRKSVPIRLEYFDAVQGAVVSLSWSSSSLPKQVIPVSALTP